MCGAKVPTCQPSPQRTGMISSLASRRGSTTMRYPLYEVLMSSTSSSATLPSKARDAPACSGHPEHALHAWSVPCRRDSQPHDCSVMNWSATSTVACGSELVMAAQHRVDSGPSCIPDMCGRPSGTCMEPPLPPLSPNTLRAHNSHFPDHASW